MSHLRFARCLIYPILVLGCISGCQVLSPHRPAPVLVRDAETKNPIAAAEVRIQPVRSDPLLGHSEQIAKTGLDGIARTSLSASGVDGVTVDVTAKEFLAEEKLVSAKEIEAIKLAGWFESVEQRPASVVVELYSGPDPTVELVAPNGYRGPSEPRSRFWTCRQAIGDSATSAFRCLRQAPPWSQDRRCFGTSS